MAKASTVDGATLFNPFLDSSNPFLDPAAPQFRYAEWLTALTAIKSRDTRRYPERAAGVAFRDLSVDGPGEHNNYQKTFGNYPLAIWDAFKQLITTFQPSKVNILQEFDGLVRSGETLLVLGRPGR